ncbi:MAG TPA: BTAD domain-containing putative transcriptional regulator [Caldilineaceae bacterium]|nr:BTAD domain-containing putative transcriptional regulator [Caldilineaceae bacterium]
MTLFLNLLGTPEIYLEDQLLLRFRTRKAQALLIYLAATNRNWTRDALATLFWPETDDAGARKNLRDILPSLRRQLGDYLLLDDEIIGIDPTSQYKCDVVLFREILERRAATIELTTLMSTLMLYRGEFLEGFATSRISVDFELWVMREREQLQQLALMGFTTLCRRQQERGDFEAALAANRQLLKLAPWDEAAHRQQMVLLAQSGQQSAALAHFESCRQILMDELDVDPNAETIQLYEQIKAGQYGSMQRANLVVREGKESQLTLRSPSNALSPAFNQAPFALSEEHVLATPVHATDARTVDWGEAPTIHFFYGRENELAQLQDWLLDANSRLIALLGMGGMGKTTLAAKVAREYAAQFESVLWRSLVNSPPLTNIVRAGLELLDPQYLADLPDTLDEQVNHLFVHLAQRRCLLILDNLESVMREDRPGEFRAGYEVYGQLLSRFGQSAHQSCLLLTSRESPRVIRQLQAGNPTVKTQQLLGLSNEAGRALLRALSLVDEEPTTLPAAPAASHIDEILQRYSGNPLALKLVATTIRDFFGGDTAPLLSDEPLIFDDIRGLLDQQYARLSSLEEELLLWLAVEREPVSFKELQANLAQPSSTRLLLEATRALDGRSLVEVEQGELWLQNMVMEYATDRLIARVAAELASWDQQEAASFTWRESFFNRFALLKAQSTSDVRHSQHRLLLQPVAQQLQRRWGEAGLAAKLKLLLNFMQHRGQGIPGYAAANLIHLYHELKLDLTGANFAGLVIRQADLRHVGVQQVDFSQADLTDSIFKENIHEVRALAVSPDGRIMTNANNSGRIDIRQMHTLRLLDTLKGHQTIVHSLVFSPDGQLLAAADSHAIIVWRRVASARWQSCLTLPAAETVAFSPDSRHLAAVSKEGPIAIWALYDAPQGYVAQLHSHCGKALNQRTIPIAFNADGETLASGEREMIHLWDVHSGTHRQTLYGHSERVHSLTFSPAEGLLASGGTDGTVRLWDVARGEQVGLLDGHRVRVLSLAFSPDGRTLATADLKTIRLWRIGESAPQQPAAESADAQRGRAVQLYFVLPGHKHFITALAFHPHGQTLVSASLDETIRLWDVRTGQRLRSLFGYQGAVYGIAIDPAEQHLITGGINGALQLWQIRGAASLVPTDTFANCPSRILAVAISPDGQSVAATCADERLRLWHLATKTLCFALHDPAFDFGLGQLAFSPDGALLATTCSDQSIRLWRCADGALQHILGGETLQFRCLAFSPDGRMLAGGTQEGRLYLWQIDAANGLDRLQPTVLDFIERECITGVKFSPEGEYLVYGANRSAFVMELPSRERRLTLVGDGVWNRALALSPRGLIAIGGGDTIRLYDAATGRAAGILAGHQDGISGLAFAASGERLYSASEAGELKVWDVLRQSCLATVRPALPYAGMDITGATGLSDAQKAALCALGAVDGARSN